MCTLNSALYSIVLYVVLNVVSMVIIFWEFEHKICYSSGFIVDISKLFASYREFLGSYNQIDI